MELKIDIDLKAINTAFKLFPKELKAATARMLNDMAFACREAAFSVIGRHYEVRKRNFVQSRFRVVKANKSDPPSKQVAWWGSIANDRFTGWAEEVGEGAKTGRARRVIGAEARDGSMGGIAKKKYRLNQPKILNRADFPGYARRQTQGAINAAYKQHGIGATVILRDGGWLPGLYEVTKAPYMDGDQQMGPEVRITQLFDQYIAENRFDWREETMNLVKPWFSPERLFQDYIAPLFTGKL
jgi:hypothetical protein